MKFTVYAFACLASVAILSSCNRPCIEGSGNQITQDRTVEPFTGIETGGSVKLILKQDSIQKVSITADDNVQEYIKTRVKGDRLVIEPENNVCNGGPVTVYVNAKNFTGVSASGAVEIVGEDRINTGDFTLDLSGDSKVNLNINAGKVKTSSKGTSDIMLQGQARRHEIELSGAGELNAFDFVVADYKIESSGSTNCKINVLNSLDVRSSGSSTIEYRGNPKQVNNDQSGAASIKKVN